MDGSDLRAEVGEEKAEDQAIEVGLLAPVLVVPRERQAAAAAPALEYEGPARDRPAGLRVVDLVPPDLVEVLVGERVLRKNGRKQVLPLQHRLPEDESDPASGRGSSRARSARTARA